jgi:hypothetical protein
LSTRLTPVIFASDSARVRCAADATFPVSVTTPFSTSTSMRSCLNVSLALMLASIRVSSERSSVLAA